MGDFGDDLGETGHFGWRLVCAKIAIYSTLSLKEKLEKMKLVTSYYNGVSYPHDHFDRFRLKPFHHYTLCHEIVQDL